MTRILHQELYKLFHRRLPWWILTLLLAFMIIIGVAMRSTYSNLLIMSCYASGDIIPLILVIVGSTIFSMEFENKTILGLLFRAPNRSVVYVAKFITLFIYAVFVQIVAIIFTILLSLIPLLKHPVFWTAIYQYHQPLWVNMLADSGVDLIVCTMIISLVCLTSCIINSNAWVIIVNAIIVFMGTDLSSQLMLAKVASAKVLRWNPLNMLNLTDQYYNYASYHPASLLSNNQLLWGTVCYIIIFTLCGHWVFVRKKW